MKHVHQILSSLVTMTLLMGLTSTLIAQCDEGQSQVVVEILTDNYPSEITWTLSDANGELLSGGPYGETGTTYSDTVCIANAEEFPCLQFVINDDFGCASACTMDINGDGVTNVTDVLLVLSAFGTTCS